MAGRNALCLHADVLVPPARLRLCFDAAHDVIAVLDAVLVEETTRARVEGEGVVEIGKNVPPGRQFGPSLGVALFALSAAVALVDFLEALVADPANRQSYFVACIPRLVSEGLNVGFVLRGGLPWVEINAMEDFDGSEPVLGRFPKEVVEGR